MASTPLPLRGRLQDFARLLRENGVDSPRLSAEVLLAHALGQDRGDLLKRLILEPDAALSEEENRRAEQLMARRARGEPVAYITGRKEFYGRDFLLSPATLVPRPETELLVDLAREEARRHPGQSGLFADFGTGSGCIAISLSLELPHWRGLALDISHEALCVAHVNEIRHEVRNLGLLLADFIFPPLATSCLDLLVSNPPYVGENEYDILDREVRDFEPRSALVPGDPGAFFPPGKATGLEHAVVILGHAARLLRPGGLLLMEIGHSQASPLLDALVPDGWSQKSIYKDLAGLDRVLSVRKSSA